MLLFLFALSACARVPPAAVRQGSTDLERALAVMVADAEHELLENGRCTWRLYARCADSFVLASGGKYRQLTQYFGPDGQWLGSETHETCRLDKPKECPRCEKPEAELLCPRVLAGFHRVESTIQYHATELRLADNTEVDAIDFRGVVNFSAEATKPLAHDH
jgi:hypothetical protein